MQSIQIGELKSQFSDILKTIKDDGKKYIIEYGRKHEKVAILIPYDKNFELKHQREFGILQGKGSFKLKKDFEISDEELFNL